MRNQWGTTVYVQKANGAIVDITTYVHAISNLATVDAARGRQTELDTRGEPGQLQIVLDNSSGDLTPGHTGSSIQLTLGMPIWIVNTIGYRSFPIFSGYLELPETVEQLKDVDNLITVSAVDRKQLLDNGRTFVSTLTEHILYNGRNTLVAHWPCNDASAQCESLVAGQLPLTVETLHYGVADWPNTPLIQFANLAGPAGDDARYPLCTSVGDGTVGLTAPRLANRALTGVTLSGYLVVSLWVLAGSYADTSQTLVIRDNAFVQDITIDYAVVASPVFWRAKVTTSGGTTTLVGGLTKAGQWQYVSVRVNTATSVVDLWVDGSPAASTTYTGTLSGQFDSIVVDNYTPASSTSQVQIHKFTSSAAYDLTTHLAQYTQGQDGLVYQRPDERVRTILGYASPLVTIPAVLDEGTTFMQRASLAGKKPGQLIDDAVDTERGRFFVDGAGICRFHNRVRTHYNL